MVTDRNIAIAEQIVKILNTCHYKSCPDFYQNGKVNLFSQRMRFTAVEMIYLFIMLEDIYGISIEKIDWNNNEIFTFDGLSAYVAQKINKEGIVE